MKKYFNSNKLPLKLYYKDGSSSKTIKTNVEPIGIIIKGHIFAFDNAPEMLNWTDTNQYCKEASKSGTKWEIPNVEQMNLFYQNFDKINKVLINFGKPRLQLKFMFWTTGKITDDVNWIVKLFDGQNVEGRHSHQYDIRLVMKKKSSFFETMEYTRKHKVSFIKHEKKITKNNSLRGYLHDLDKLLFWIPVSYLFNKDKNWIQKKHRERSRHHVNDLFKTREDLIQMIIDWACASDTKPDKHWMLTTQ